MVQNPYAAPGYQPNYNMPAGPSPGGGGAPQPWDVGEVLTHGWEMFKRFPAVLLLAPLVAGMITNVPSMLFGGIGGAMSANDPDSVGAIVMQLFGTMISVPLSIFFSVGTWRINLAAARGQDPDFMLLFSGADRFLPMLLVGLVSGIAVLFGTLALIVPGVILALGLMLATPYCIDANLDPMESLQKSWESTKGHKGALFVFFLAVLLLFVAGMCACGIGIFIVSPVASVAMATIYLRISGQGAAPTPGFGSMGPPPGRPASGGWGAPPQQGPPQGAPQGSWGAPPQQGPPQGGPPQGSWGG